jgi:hypothetical protein
MQAEFTAYYTIPANHLYYVSSRVEKLNKRAVRLNLPTIDLNILGERFIDKTPENKDSAVMSGGYVKPSVKILVYDVELTGASPRVGNFHFVATLQNIKTDDGVVNIIRSVPGEELPEEFRNASQTCDHCKVNRFRNDTYVIRQDTEYKQVGSTCLKDFLGHADPHSIASYAEMLGSLVADFKSAEDDDSFGGGSRGREMFDTMDILTIAASVIRTTGWVSKKKADESFDGKTATATNVSLLTFGWLSLKDEVKAKLRAVYTTETADKATAQATYDWVAAKRQNANLSDYEHNLVTALSLEAIEHRLLGLTVSAVAMYLRDQELLAEAARKSNEFVGTVGDRVEFELTVKFIRAYENNFGTGERYTFEDANGNAFVWFTSSVPSYVVGETYRLVARIKDHNDYNGRKQTVLTRVSTPKVKKPRKVKTEVVAA